MREEQSKPTIIDEDGKPFIDGGQRAQQPGDIPFGAMPFGAAQFGAMPTPQIPEKYLGRDGKPSLVKILGWKGIAFLVVVLAGIVALAIASIAVAVVVVPILLILGAIGWVVAKVRGPQRPAQSASRVIVVRNR